MTKHDKTLPSRLLALLDSGIPPADRSLLRLAHLLGMSKGSIEYNLRKLRQDGLVFRDADGVLQSRAGARQLPLQLQFPMANVVEISQARFRRSRLDESTRAHCAVVVTMQLPSALTAESIADVLVETLGARDVRVFGEARATSPSAAVIPG